MATRRKYSPEERIHIVLERFRREVTVNKRCRRQGIKPHSYYAWTKELMEAGRERLARGECERPRPRRETPSTGSGQALRLTAKGLRPSAHPVLHHPAKVWGHPSPRKGG